MKRMLKFKEFSDFLIEKSLPVNVGPDTIGHIESEDEETKKRLSRIVGSSSVKQDLINFLIGINFPKQQAELMFDVLSHSNDITKLKDYLMNRTTEIGSLIGKVNEASAINQSLGIPEEISSQFFNFSWRTSPPMKVKKL
jgi:hypothetical protein